MRTDSQTKKSEVSNADCTESKETMKVARKTLHPLQVAAGDKENLVGAGRMLPTKADNEFKVAPISCKVTDTGNSPKREKKKTSKSQDKKKITVEDLTSEEGPSEHYWEVLAETRRQALEKALLENQQLNERVEELKEEIKKYKDLLNEAQDIVDILNGIVSESTNDEGSEGEEDAVRRP